LGWPLYALGSEILNTFRTGSGKTLIKAKSSKKSARGHQKPVSYYLKEVLSQVCLRQLFVTNIFLIMTHRDNEGMKNHNFIA
jgi:hypothetical protein